MNADTASRRGMTHGIGEQVAQHLLDASRIDSGLKLIPGKVPGFEFEVSRFGRCRIGLNHMLNQFAKIGASLDEREGASICHAQGVQIFHKSIHELGLTQNGAQVLLIRRMDTIEDRFQAGLDHCQRRAEFMRDVSRCLPPALFEPLKRICHGVKSLR
ncbi:MAG: hypothetical protein P8X64_13865 [Anaerolineales bacterium]